MHTSRQFEKYNTQATWNNGQHRLHENVRNLVGHNVPKCTRNNWGNKVKELERLFESWKKKKINYIFGKAYIVNSLAVSKTNI
jgi:hypothetical protein